MKIFAEVGDKVHEIERIDKNGETVYKMAGKAQTIVFIELGHNRYSLIHNNRSHLIHIIKQNGLYHVHLDGYYFAIRVEDERMRAIRELVQKSAQVDGKFSIRAPIPGLITQLKVKEGDTVPRGSALLILEAMKMENELRAEYTGTVEKIMVSAGSPVEKDQELLIMRTG